MSAAKPMTWKQKERQEARSRTGRYNILNPCECCGKSAGADYYSDPRVDKAQGRGLVLCGKCADYVGDMPDDEFIRGEWVGKGRTTKRSS